MLEAKILGQLLLMQSVLTNLPDKRSILEFVSRGLLDIPGVAHADFYPDEKHAEEPGLVSFSVTLGTSFFGTLILTLNEPEAFRPYHVYVKNFVFTVAVVLQERKLSAITEQHQLELETQVRERTEQLRQEVGVKEQIADTLRESEERFRLLIEQAPDAVYLCDMDGQLMITNDVACRMLGYSKEEILLKKVMDLDATFPTLKKLRELWDNMKIGDPLTIKGQHIRKDGKVIPVDISTSLIIIDGERHVLGYARDISQLIESEKALKESELKFRTFYNAVEDMFIVHPMLKEGLAPISDANDIALQKLGYSRKELLNKTILDLCPDEEHDRFLDPSFRQKAMEKGSLTFETRFITSKGSWFPVEINANILNIEGSVMIISVARDITERKLAERKQRDLMERNKLILETTLSGFILADSSGKILDVNEAYTRIVGYDRSKIIGKNLTELEEKLDPDEISHNLESLTRNGGFRFTTRHRHRTGAFRDLQMSVSLMDQEGKSFIVIFCQDITEQKAAEEEVKRQNEIYQKLNREYMDQNAELVNTLRKITEINEQLEEAKLRAEESDRLKSAFLANMSHEIRTPMNGILGFADLLKNPDLSNQKQEQYLELISKSGERMLGIINDLVDISRIESGQVQLNPEKFSVNEVFSYLYDFFMPEAAKRNLKFSYEIGDCCNNDIVADRSRFMQILTNLLKNALKFTERGGISFGCERKKQECVFFVRDTGEGIDPADQEHIFERFRQANRTGQRPEEGTGLGLSISRAFVEMMGGKIWVESETGKGSVFRFSLSEVAVSEKVEVFSNQDKAWEQTSFNFKKILVVEDDDISFMLIEEMFDESNVKVLRATNGIEALKLVKTHQDFDCVLMDLRMPEMDGFKASEMIKEMYPGLPVIAQTAFAASEDKKRAFEAGCDEYITKPVSREELIKKLGHLKQKA